VSPVKYELGFYIPEDDILHSHRREHSKSLLRVSIPTAAVGPQHIANSYPLLCWRPLCLRWSDLRRSTVRNKNLNLQAQ
jgi:hypothetical protein